MGALKWILEFVDRISGPSKPMVGAIKGITVSVNQARAMFKAAGNDVDKFKAKLKQMGASALDSKLLVSKMNAELAKQRKQAMGFGGGKGLDAHKIWIASHAMNVAARAYGAVSTGLGFVAGAAEKAVSVGSSFAHIVLDSAQFRENTLQAFELMLGSKDAAVKMFETLHSFSMKTPQRFRDIIEGANSLLTGGVPADEIIPIAKAASDVFTQKGNSPEAAQRFIDTMLRAQSQPTVSMREFRSLIGLVDLNKIYRVIGEQMKMTGTPEKIVEDVRKKVSKHEVGSDLFKYATLQATRKNDMPLGAFSESHMNTLTGVLSNAETAFDRLLLRVNMSEWPGIVALKTFLMKVVDIMDAGSASGKRLIASVEKVTNALFGGLGSITDMDIERFLDTIALAADEVAKMLKRAWKWMEELLHTGNISNAVGDALTAAGEYLGKGIWLGLKTAMFSSDNTPADITAGTTMRDHMVMPWESEYWQWSPGGQGGLPPPPSFRVDKDPGGPRQQAQVNITVHAGEGADPGSIADAIKDPARQGVMSGFEQLAAEHGVGR